MEKYRKEQKYRKEYKMKFQLENGKKSLYDIGSIIPIRNCK